MCIRDSTEPDRADRAAGSRSRRGAGRIHRQGELRARGAAAVSYTHLRAHETVLDLVCRLLLEKKKKQK